MDLARRVPDRRLVAWTGIALALVCGAVVLAHVTWAIPIRRPDLGVIELGTAGLVVQLAALVAGVMALHLARGPAVRWLIAAEGAVCLFAYGAPGLAFALGLVAWWAVIDARRLGRARFALAAVLFVALDACAWRSDRLASPAKLFSMMFAMRLFVFTYDRWQNEHEPTPLGDFLAFMLPAPLVIVPPYLSIIPLFDGFGAKLRPELTPARLRAIGKHLALAILFGGMRVAMDRLGLRGEHAQPATMHWRLLANILGLAAIAHLLIPMLLLHGIEERLPLDRPLLATRFVELWQRFSVHLKDAQVFLFYTPALLRLRRANRYLAIVLATFWTILVGNTLVHAAVHYCFLPDTARLIGWSVVANAVMAAALAADLCYEERWSRRGRRPPRTVPRLVIGWLLTMTLASVIAML
ncbi:MAG TPA: hypothetical protein VN253_29420 [Kofleriaceae bacterium]|nr:hypothetical protein [Kofleriaceae bacterium]